MCYSAQVWADYRKYVRHFGAALSLEEFSDLFFRRQTDAKLKVPRGMATAFTETKSLAEQKIKSAIDAFDAAETTRLEQELFTQRTRLNDAERALATKITKAATESKRIAADKIERAKARLEDLRRTEPKDRDGRIYPGYYAPVMIMENRKLVIKPMRYGCRPHGKPANYDTKYPGTYNSRRDNLTGFWKGQFGHTHGIVGINAFYENVNRHRVEGRELAEGEKPANVVLAFNPKPQQDMFVACVWSHWIKDGEPDLWSFAAITDEPPAEVSAAGHDRCIIPIKPENIPAWLNPEPANLDAQSAILNDRERPYYEHRTAA